MKGLIADVNVIGHVERLVQLMHFPPRDEVWSFLALQFPRFEDVDLQFDDSDATVWLTCQREQLVLVTANRNEEGEESLEATINRLNSAESLPVITLADADRVLRDANYAARVADRLLGFLFDIDQFRGTGRLFVP